MDEKITAALIIALGMVLSVIILTASDGIKLNVSIPQISLNIPKISVSSESDIGRYKYIPTKDGVCGCFDTTTGREYAYFFYGGTNGSNRMLEFDYIKGRKYLLNDFNETSR